MSERKFGYKPLGFCCCFRSWPSRGIFRKLLDRLVVSFEYEWHDDKGQWYRSYGNEVWEFDEEGLMRRLASINDALITFTDRRIL